MPLGEQDFDAHGPLRTLHHQRTDLIDHDQLVLRMEGTVRSGARIGIELVWQAPADGPTLRLAPVAHLANERIGLVVAPHVRTATLAA